MSAIGVHGAGWLWLFWCVLIANCGTNADLLCVSEHTSSNIRAVRVVAEIFGKQFFVAIRTREARFNRYQRNGESPPSWMSPLSYGLRTLAQASSAGLEYFPLMGEVCRHQRTADDRREEPH
jgi:hypothetical protein